LGELMDPVGVVVMQLEQRPPPVRSNSKQKLVKPMSWVGSYTSEDVGEPSLRIDAVHFAGLCRPPNYAESGRFPPISG
jgi:hypothetical protein